MQQVLEQMPCFLKVKGSRSFLSLCVQQISREV